MIRNKRQMFIVLAVFTAIVFLGGIAYAIFNYARIGESSTLLVGNIYMNHTEGTAISLVNESPSKQENARKRTDNAITIQITGVNESKEDIYYKLMLDYGDQITGKTRMKDKSLRFDFLEILPNNEEKYIIYSETFDNIENLVLTRDRILAETNSTVTRTYKLRMWIDEDTIVSDTEQNADYTTQEFENLFASVKIYAKGEMEEVFYYNSFDNALTDINSGTFESETDRENAKVGIYVDHDDNTNNLVLYDDVETSEYTTITNQVNINLYENTLSYKKSSSDVVTGLYFKADFTLENGTIEEETNSGSMYSYAVLNYGYKGIINNINIPYVTIDIFNYFRNSQGATTIIKNSTIRSVEVDSYTNSSVDILNSNLSGEMQVYNSSTMKMLDSDIDNGDDTEDLVIIYDPTSKLVVENTTLFADSPGCYTGSNNYIYSSVGIYNGGTLIFKSGYVFGTHSAVQTNNGSKTYVYGGTFESTDHGGFYFAQGPTGIAYIENANINGINYPARGKYRPNGTAEPSYTVNGVVYNLEEIKAAFYIGGNSAQNGESVYLVNCNISAPINQVIVMRNSTPQQSLYMSGVKFLNTTANMSLRVDIQDTMRLYFGKNNDFGLISNISRNSNTTFTEARALGVIVDTNTDYKDVVKPTD